MAEKCFVCTCIHACHRKISILLLTKAITQFIFSFSNSYLQQRIFFEIKEFIFVQQFI